MIEIRRIDDLGLHLPELHFLHRKHWEEAGEDGEFAFRYDLLKRMWEQGMVRAWGIFDEGRLVGHGTAYVLADMVTGRMNAEDQAMYVLPEYRSGYGAAMFRLACEDLKREGIVDFGATIACENRTALLAQRLGFKHTANRYVKRLNQGHSNEQAITARSA